MSIVAIEDHLVCATKEAFGRSLRTVDHLPAQWTHDTLRRVALDAPAIYFAYVGGRRHPKRVGVEASEWHAYVFVAAGNVESQRRRGDVRATGAYQLTDALRAVFDDQEVPGHDALRWQRTDNLFDDFLNANAITGYRLQFELDRTLPTRGDAEASLGAFLQMFVNEAGELPTADADQHIEIPQE